jgi:hypothetical protein
VWNDLRVESGDWRPDARAVGMLRVALASWGTHPARPAPERRRELAAVLATMQERLRRRLLHAEGLDPDTGRPIC